MDDNTIVLKIKQIKNNCFISLTLMNGKLIAYTSLKQKKLLDAKLKITWGLINLLKKFKISTTLKIKYIHLYIQNLELILIQHIFTFFKTWNIWISFFKYEIPVSHNGCRKKHKTRIRSKNKIYISNT